jgi:hypothetical protein
MEDIPGADTDDGVFDAPSPIEMEVYEGGAHDENPAQGDVDSRNVEQTPPHGHDSEHGIFDRSKNIYFLYFSLKDLYFIFIYSPSSSSLYFCSPHTFLGTFQMLMKFLDFLIRLLALGTTQTSPRMSQDTLLQRGVLPQYLPLPTSLM